MVLVTDKKEKCAWCGRTLEEHEERRAPNAPVPRVPCLLLKTGFVAKKGGE